MMRTDGAALQDVVLAVRASSQSHLRNNVDPSISCEMLYQEPAKHRGKVITLDGILALITRRNFQDGIAGLEGLYEGQIFHQGQYVISFYSLEPIPQSLKDRPVRLTGVFFKKYAFENRKISGRATLSPQLVVRRVESRPGVSIGGFMNNPTVLLIFTAIALGVLALYLVRGLRPRPPASPKRTKRRAPVEPKSGSA